MTSTKIGFRLEAIEKALNQNKTIYNADEAASYLSMAKSYLYKLTSTGRIKFSRPGGKKIFFNRQDLDAYLLQNPSRTNDELETEASTFVTSNS